MPVVIFRNSDDFRRFVSGPDIHGPFCFVATERKPGYISRRGRARILATQYVVEWHPEHGTRAAAGSQVLSESVIELQSMPTSENEQRRERFRRAGIIV